MPTFQREAIEKLGRRELISLAEGEGFKVATSITKTDLLQLLAPTQGLQRAAAAAARTQGVEAAGNGEMPDPSDPPVQDAPGHSAASTTPDDEPGEAEFPDEDRTIHDRVLAVFTAMPIIEKSGTAPGNMGGYSFRRVEDITAALKPLLAKQGVAIVPTILDRVSSERTTANNKSLWVEDLLIEFRFTDWQGETLVATMWGQGTDSGDKAVQKAVTSAFKSMLSVTFCITDQADDSEAHDVPESAPKPSEDDLAREAGWPDAAAEGEAHVRLSRRIKALLPDDVDEARQMRADLGWPVRPHSQFLVFAEWVTNAEQRQRAEQGATGSNPAGRPVNSS